MGMILKKADLVKIISQLKAKGKRIVFTNGCFDIIHAGHIRYLKEAKKFGDFLIVGMNSDKSVSRIKPGRPVNSEQQRAEVLSSLEMVDYVVIFDEDTPYELIRSIKPDVLVKGGDWKKKDIIGSDIAGETHSLPYLKGISTTAIIDKIKKL